MPTSDPKILGLVTELGSSATSPIFHAHIQEALVAQNYKLVIHAEGEVRDADGNLVSTEPLEGQTVLTEEQAKRLLEQIEQQEQRLRVSRCPSGRDGSDTRTVSRDSC